MNPKKFVHKIINNQMLFSRYTDYPLLCSIYSAVTIILIIYMSASVLFHNISKRFYMILMLSTVYDIQTCFSIILIRATSETSFTK